MTDELEAVRQAAERMDQDREALHSAIRAAADNKHSLRSIAEAARLSHQTVANILERTQP